MLLVLLAILPDVSISLRKKKKKYFSKTNYTPSTLIKLVLEICVCKHLQEFTEYCCTYNVV